MARKVLRFSARKNAIYDRRDEGISIVSSVVPLLALAAQNANVSSCVHKSSSLMDKALEHWIYIYRDLYMPQRAD